MRSALLPTVAGLFLAGCGAIQATKSMPGKMDDMTARMARLNSVVDLQAVLLPFEAMLKTEYGRDMDPIAFDLIPFAKKFAQHVESQDVPEFVFLWMKKLNDMPFSGARTQEAVNEFNRRKQQTYQALMAVCGFLPDEVVREIIEREIHHFGRYRESVLQALMLRALFVHEVQLEADLFSGPLDTVGKVEAAIGMVEKIDFIARLRFVGDISVDVVGFEYPEDPIHARFNLDWALGGWNAIKEKSAELKNGESPLTGDPALDSSLRKAEADRRRKAIAIVEARIRSWEK